MTAMARRPWGSGSLYKRSLDGRWVGSVEVSDASGQRRRRTVTGKDRAKVRRRMAELSASSKSRTPITLGEYLASWLDDAVTPNVRAVTAANYRGIATRHLIPALGAIPLVELTAPDVRAFSNDRLAAGAHPRTVQHGLAVLKTALNQAVDDGLLDRNPVRSVKPPKVEAKQQRILTVAQAATLLDAVRGDRLEALYVLALLTGMRQGELLGLTWDNVELERGQLHVRASLARLNGRMALVPPKTPRSVRSIPLGEWPELVPLLRDHQRRQMAERTVPGRVEQGLVFTEPHGSPIANYELTRRFQRILAGKRLPKVTFHSMRAYAATDMARRGMPPRLLMALLGHSSIVVTMDVYAHADSADVAAAVRRALA